MFINKNVGMSIMEILIVIFIITIISSITFTSLSGFRNDQILRSTTADVVSILNKARQNTLSSLSSTNYGVHFDTDKAVLFIGSTYSSSASTNEVTIFSSAVIIPTSDGLNIGGGHDVIFERLTGDTVGGTIKIQLVSDLSKYKVITISKVGSVSFN